MTTEPRAGRGAIVLGVFCLLPLPLMAFLVVVGARSVIAFPSNPVNRGMTLFLVAVTAWLLATGVTLVRRRVTTAFTGSAAAALLAALVGLGTFVPLLRAGAAIDRDLDLKAWIIWSVAMAVAGSGHVAQVRGRRGVAFHVGALILIVLGVAYTAVRHA